MKVTEITITYGEARSARYQKVDHSAQLTVQLDDSETVRDAIAKYRPALRETVTDFTRDEIVRLAEEDEAMTSRRR